MAWDRCGTGLSDPIGGPLALADEVEDLVAVLDAAGSERAALPDRVRRRAQRRGALRRRDRAGDGRDRDGGSLRPAHRECERVGDDLGGMAVHIAAHVSALAAPREALASGTTYGTVVGSGLSFEDRGSQALKGVPGHWPLFALERPGVQAAQPGVGRIA